MLWGSLLKDTENQAWLAEEGLSNKAHTALSEHFSSLSARHTWLDIFIFKLWVSLSSFWFMRRLKWHVPLCHMVMSIFLRRPGARCTISAWEISRGVAPLTWPPYFLRKWLNPLKEIEDILQNHCPSALCQMEGRSHGMLRYFTFPIGINVDKVSRFHFCHWDKGTPTEGSSEEQRLILVHSSSSQPPL